MRLLRRLVKTSLLLGVVAGIAVLAKNAPSLLKPATTDADTDELDEPTNTPPNTEEGSL